MQQQSPPNTTIPKANLKPKPLSNELENEDLTIALRVCKKSRDEYAKRSAEVESKLEDLELEFEKLKVELESEEQSTKTLRD